jgi:hypothetical protein
MASRVLRCETLGSMEDAEEAEGKKDGGVI